MTRDNVDLQPSNFQVRKWLRHGYPLYFPIVYNTPEHRREYQKRYRAIHPEQQRQQREYRRRYYATHVEQERARNKQRRRGVLSKTCIVCDRLFAAREARWIACSDECRLALRLANWANYYQQHKTRLTVRSRAYYANNKLRAQQAARQWRAANHDRHLSNFKQWYYRDVETRRLRNRKLHKTAAYRLKANANARTRYRSDPFFRDVCIRRAREARLKGKSTRIRPDQWSKIAKLLEKS